MIQEGPGEDGGLNIQKVSKEGHGHVDAVTESEFAHVSRVHKTSFAFRSQFETTGASQEFFSFQNDESDTRFTIWTVHLRSVLANTVTLGLKTSGTPAGTDVVGVNLHFGSGVTKDYTCKGNAEVTGTVAGTTIIDPGLVAAAADRILPMEGGMSLGNGECIFASSLAATTVTITLVGYWHVR